jgi:hypothetical protein
VKKLKDMAATARPTRVGSAVAGAGTAAIPATRELFIAVEIEQVQPLVQNCFNQKAVEEMLRKHMGLPVERSKKVPADCIERAIVRNTAGAICIPTVAIKQAMVTAAGQVKGLKKTVMNVSIFVVGGSVPISYSRMVPRMDMVRTSGMGRVPDVRFRPMFEDWKARLIIEFSDTLPVQTVIELLNRAGKVGVQEWRPEKKGTFGQFQVSRCITDPPEIEEVRRICRPQVVPLRIPDWAMNVELPPELLAKIAQEQDTGSSPE